MARIAGLAVLCIALACLPLATLAQSTSNAFASASPQPLLWNTRGGIGNFIPNAALTTPARPMNNGTIVLAVSYEGSVSGFISSTSSGPNSTTLLRAQNGEATLPLANGNGGVSAAFGVALDVEEDNVFFVFSTYIHRIHVDPATLVMDDTIIAYWMPSATLRAIPVNGGVAGAHLMVATNTTDEMTSLYGYAFVTKGVHAPNAKWLLAPRFNATLGVLPAIVCAADAPVCFSYDAASSSVLAFVVVNGTQQTAMATLAVAALSGAAAVNMSATSGTLVVASWMTVVFVSYGVDGLSVTMAQSMVSQMGTIDTPVTVVLAAGANAAFVAREGASGGFIDVVTSPVASGNSTRVTIVPGSFVTGLTVAAGGSRLLVWRGNASMPNVGAYALSAGPVFTTYAEQWDSAPYVPLFSQNLVTVSLASLPTTVAVPPMPYPEAVAVMYSGGSNANSMSTYVNYLSTTDGRVVASIHAPSSTTLVAAPPTLLPARADGTLLGVMTRFEAATMHSSFMFVDMTQAPTITQADPNDQVLRMASVVNPTTGGLYSARVVAGVAATVIVGPNGFAASLPAVLNYSLSVALYPADNVLVVWGATAKGAWQFLSYYICALDVVSGNVLWSQAPANMPLVWASTTAPTLLISFSGANTPLASVAVYSAVTGTRLSNPVSYTDYAVDAATVPMQQAGDNLLLVSITSGAVIVSLTTAEVLTSYATGNIGSAALTSPTVATLCLNTGDAVQLTAGVGAVTVSGARCVGPIVASRNYTYSLALVADSILDEGFAAVYLVRMDFSNVTAAVGAIQAYPSVMVQGALDDAWLTVADEHQIAVIGITSVGVVGVDLITGAVLWYSEAASQQGLQVGSGAANQVFVANSAYAQQIFGVVQALSIFDGAPTWRLPIYGFIGGSAGIAAVLPAATLAASKAVVQGQWVATYASAGLYDVAPPYGFRNASLLVVFPATGDNVLPPNPTLPPFTPMPTLPDFPPPATADDSYSASHVAWIAVVCGVAVSLVGFITRLLIRRRRRVATPAGTDYVPVMGQVVPQRTAPAAAVDYGSGKV